MKRNKSLLLLLTIAFCLVFTLAFTACDEEQSSNSVLSTLDVNQVYNIACAQGFEGSLEDFIDTFKGDSAYKLAVDLGYSGTEEEWLNSLQGAAGKDGSTPSIGNNGNWWINNLDLGITATGKDGNGISLIEEVTSDVDGKTKIQITFTNNTKTCFYLANGTNGKDGKDGSKGDTGASGNGISSVEKTNTQGLVDTYTIVFTDNTQKTYTINNGKDGIDGNGIASIAKTATNDLVDTYTINFTDGTHSTFDITNGAAGTNGKDGVSISNATINDSGELVIVLTNEESINVGKVVGLKGDKGDKGDQGSTGANGSDGISITNAEINDNGELVLSFSEGDSINLGVVVGSNGQNGNDGEDGTSIEGVKIENDELIITIGENDINLGNIKGEKGDKGDTGSQGIQGIQGEAGATGNGISTITLTSTSGNVDTYTITFTDGTYTTFNIVNGTNGAKGDKGDKGDTGETGNGIASIAKTSTNGLVDTYTITFTNGTTTTFDITNGTNGDKGNEGDAGKSAYELYKEKYGYEGTEDEWLEELNIILNSKNEAGLEYYLLSDSTYGVKIGKALYCEEITIPSEYMGKAVTKILDSFSGSNSTTYNTTLKTIILPNTITEIGQYAFYMCTSLTNVSLSSGLTKIGQYAFYGCSKMADVVIPQSVTTIGARAFENASGFEFEDCDIWKTAMASKMSYTYKYYSYNSGSADSTTTCYAYDSYSLEILISKTVSVVTDSYSAILKEGGCTDQYKQFSLQQIAWSR